MFVERFRSNKFPEVGDELSYIIYKTHIVRIQCDRCRVDWLPRLVT